MLSEKPDNLSFKLSTYIAAQSRRRIARRFGNKKSQPYFDSLKRVKVEDIPQLSEQATDDRPGTTPVDKKEFDSDRLFLEEFLGPYNKKGCPNTGIDTTIEHLLKKVDESLTVPGAIELYTNDTRTEFHGLLLFLLRRFQDILNILVPDINSDLHGLQPSKFKEAVEQLNYYAYALLRLARGRAFRMHVENIEHLLDDPHAGASTDERNEEHDNVEQEEDFDDLPLQKSKSYVAWLRLIVAHFDAVEILARFVLTNSYRSISIQILVPPSTSSEQLPWRGLFTKYIQNKTAFEFLENGLSAVRDRNAKEGRRKKDADIEALSENLKQHPVVNNFFIYLARQQIFTGALHCEAHLASLLPAFTKSLSTPDDTEYKEMEILQQLEVKYISCHLSGPHFLFFAITAFWIGDWSIETLLPDM
jgi:hypothetical protein